MPELIDGAFRFVAFLSFLGRIVSLLGLRRKLPSARPEAERSWPMPACATEGTVSVSTVMLRRGGSVRDRFESDENEAFEEIVFDRCKEVARCSCILPLASAFDAPSLPLSLFLVLLRLELELRSSLTLDELTSFRSSSEVLDVVAEETKLKPQSVKLVVGT